MRGRKTDRLDPGQRPAPEIRGHGVLQKGNVALASNGTTVEGPTDDRDIMLGENIVPGGATQAKSPCEFTITFDKIYQLRQIRILIFGDAVRFLRRAVSRDGRRFDLLEDHRMEKMQGWQDLRFSPGPSRRSNSCVSSHSQ